jgi:hypothetical protein
MGEIASDRWSLREDPSVVDFSWDRG